MSFKKKAEDTSFSGSKEDAVVAMLHRLALVEVQPSAVNIKFPTLEGASVFRDQWESLLGKVYAGKTIRWSGDTWVNKPACKVVQSSVLARMLKWGPEKRLQRLDDARRQCSCADCGHAVVQWCGKSWSDFTEADRAALVAHVLTLAQPQRTDYGRYLKRFGVPADALSQGAVHG